MHAIETAPLPTEDPRLQRFQALYRGEFGFVWAAARHLGVPSGAVDDVVQDVFITAYRRLDHLHFEVSPRAWLFGVTRRIAFRYRRGTARMARRHANFAELARPDPGAPQQRHDDAQQLERLLGRLGEGTRNVWEMTELLGMSAPEIASELGLPLNTVYSRLRLARAQLQALAADPEQLAAWRDAARRHQAPPQEAPQRAWALLLPALGKGAGVVAWAHTQAATAITWVAVGAAAIGVVVLREPRPAPEARPAVVAAAPARIDAPAPRIEPAPPTPAPLVDLSPRPAPASPRPGLAEEVALIDRAHAQLAADDAAAALVTLAGHARRFPAGALADAREAARCDALCRVGDAAAAEAVASQLLASHPTSTVAQRFENYRCPR